MRYAVWFGRRFVWSRHCSFPIHVGSLTLPVIMACLFSSISIYSLVEWSERFVVCSITFVGYALRLQYSNVLCFIWFYLNACWWLSCRLSVIFYCGIQTLSVFNLAFGAMILCYPFGWQIKGKLVIMLISVNRVTAGFHYLMASFVELFLFRIFSLMWSELDGQASLVLQRSASWLMRSSTFVAVYVTFHVTRHVTIQENYEIFRFCMVFCYDDNISVKVDFGL